MENWPHLGPVWRFLSCKRNTVFISFFLPQLLLFFPYKVLSPGVVTAHFWTFTRSGYNEWTITLIEPLCRHSLCHVLVLRGLTVIRQFSLFEQVLNKHYLNHKSTVSCYQHQKDKEASWFHRVCLHVCVYIWMNGCCCKHPVSGTWNVS